MDSKDKQELMEEFNRFYAPFTVPGTEIPPRTEEEMTGIDDEQPLLRSLARRTDMKRSEDPYIGAKLAGSEILESLVQVMAKTGKGVHAPTLLAILGACGGRELCKGILTSLAKMGDGQPAAQLGVYIVGTKSGERYLIGDLAGAQFCNFYLNAAADGSDPYEVLLPISKKAAETLGTEDYWQTKFNKLIGADPLQLSKSFEGNFDKTLAVFTRFPAERMLSFAIAVQQALEQTDKVMDRREAMKIVAEYGWRTSHFIG
ncbi:MAG: hypothetical protein IJ806_00700 [Ruminococcus sp.]|nr:hypothetical protein [Ruminococcus sp.]